jgi:hypothetical protein
VYVNVRYQKAGLKHGLKTGKGYFENVGKFKYLRKTGTDQNCMHKEIESRLNSENACYHSLFYRLLSRNVKVKVYKTTVLPVVLYGCET